MSELQHWLPEDATFAPQINKTSTAMMHLRHSLESGATGCGGSEAGSPGKEGSVADSVRSSTTSVVDRLYAFHDKVGGEAAQHTCAYVLATLNFTELPCTLQFLKPCFIATAALQLPVTVPNPYTVPGPFALMECSEGLTLVHHPPLLSQAKAKLEEKREMLNGSYDPATGRQLYKPEVGRAPRSLVRNR
jgi:hypothetical protein